MEFNINNKNFSADDNSIIYLPPKTAHSYTYKACKNTDYYWLHFAGEYADELMNNIDFYNLPWYNRAKHSSSRRKNMANMN